MQRYIVVRYPSDSYNSVLLWQFFPITYFTITFCIHWYLQPWRYTYRNGWNCNWNDRRRLVFWRISVYRSHQRWSMVYRIIFCCSDGNVAWCDKRINVEITCIPVGNGIDTVALHGEYKVAVEVVDNAGRCKCIQIEIVAVASIPKAKLSI